MQTRRNGDDDAIAGLARHCLHTGFADLPPDVVRMAKRQVTDTIGIALAGRDADGVAELRELTLEFGGRPEALLWGTRSRAPVQDAARVNATMAHALDFDDTYEPAVLHPAVITVPIALTVADFRSAQVTGKELITTVALGVDIACRLARSGRPGVPGFETGWHNTTLYGYLAATMVAGRLLGLAEADLVSALGIAYHQTGGNSQAHLEGALTKRMGPGFAAYAGVLAARLAQRGVRGAAAVLEGRRGLFRQYFGGDYSRELLLGGLGREFLGAEVSFKPWPACRGAHTAVDAALSLAQEDCTNAGHIERITIWNAPAEYSLLADPLERKRRPETVVDAQFSVPWVVAAALVDHAVTLSHLTPDALQRGDLLALTARTTTAQDASLARPDGGPGAARVELALRDGRVVSRTCTHASGGPDRPMSDEQLRAKFLGCAQTAGVSDADASGIMRRLEDLEDAPDVTQLMRAMESPGPLNPAL